MSKDIKIFQICITDYSDSSVHIFSRALPSDIKGVELEELLSIEGVFDQSTCYLMFAPKLKIELEA